MSATITRNEVLDKLSLLPSLPAIVQEVIASFNNASLDATSLARKVVRDQGLSANILRLANSSFYGLPRKIGSIQDAVVVLGFDTVRSLALTAGMSQVFPSSPGSLFDWQSYWQRSYRVAVICNALANELRQEQTLAFTAGMFCDIGQVVLDLCIPQRYSALLGVKLNADQLLLDLERTEFGFDHAEIGADLLLRWNFPDKIVLAARHWQRPELQVTFDPLVCLVHIAAVLESGVNGHILRAHLPEKCLSHMPITWERIEACLPRPDQFDDTASLT